MLEGEDEMLQRHINEEKNIWAQNGGKYKSLAEAQLQIRLSVPKKEWTNFSLQKGTSSFIVLDSRTLGCANPRLC